MQALPHRSFILCSEKLCDYNRSTGGKSSEKAHDQGNNLCGRPAHAGQSLFPHKMPHDYGVNGVVQLLEKCTEYNRKKEKKKLSPDDTFRDLIRS